MGRKRPEEWRELERELEETRCLLQQARVAFDMVSDPDLIEAWAYEIQAKQARYSYLIKCRRALEEERREVAT